MILSLSVYRFTFTVRVSPLRFLLFQIHQAILQASGRGSGKKLNESRYRAIKKLRKLGSEYQAKGKKGNTNTG